MTDQKQPAQGPSLGHKGLFVYIGLDGRVKLEAVGELAEVEFMGLCAYMSSIPVIELARQVRHGDVTILQSLQKIADTMVQLNTGAVEEAEKVKE